MPMCVQATRLLTILLLLLAATACDTHTPAPDMPELYRFVPQRVILSQGTPADGAAPSGSGNILDLRPSYVLATESPSSEEERVSLASGDQLAVRRTHIMQIPVTEAEAAEFAEYIARATQCPVRAYVLGVNGSEHWVWQEPTRMNIRDAGTGAGGLGAKVIELRTRVFDAAVWRGRDLAAGVPWVGTTRAIDGELSYPAQSGREGPSWFTDAGAPDIQGAYDTGTAVLDLVAPMEGAALSLSSREGPLTGTLTFLDWFGDPISAESGTDPAAVVPAYTWSVRVAVTETPGRPLLAVDRAGTPLHVRPGEVVADCETRAVAPFWLDVIREDGPILADITSLTGTGDPLTNVDIVVEGNVEFTRAVVDTGSGPSLDEEYPILEATDTFTYVYNTGSKTVTANSVVYDANADETTIGIDESISLSESVPVRVEIPFTLPPPLGS